MTEPGPETHWSVYQHRWDGSVTFVDWCADYAMCNALADRMFKSDKADGEDDRTIVKFSFDPPSYGEIIG